jgi:predicted O-linked N-acetylglucosamine transferase (SPINDLY family)
MENSQDIEVALERIREQTERGLLDDAEATCKELLQRAQHEPEAWAWRGLLMLARARLTDAEVAFRQALALQPENPHYLTYVSTAVRGQGRAVQAEEFARQAIAACNKHAAYWVNLGAALGDQLRWPEAAQAYRQALERNPQDAATWRALAVAEQESGDLDAAQIAFERSLAIDTSDIKTVIGYAFLLTQCGQPKPAIGLLSNVVARAPQVTMAWVVLSRASQLIGDLAQAELACRRALEIDPQQLDLQFDLAAVLIKRWSLAEAEVLIRQVLAAEPQRAAAWTILGLLLRYRAEHAESLAALGRAVSLDTDPRASSAVLTGWQYEENANLESLLRAHQEWHRARVWPHFCIQPTPRSVRHSSERLRLGLISGDFSEHPVGFLVLPAIEQLNKRECSVICYSDRLAEDSYTARFRAASDVWRITCGMSDEDVAQKVQADNIDILIDLSGHFGDRMLVFAHRPAPVQITWFGYVGTTGLPAIDYLLADRFHVQDGEERWYTESILRMPHGYACYGPPADAPDVTSLPALESGQVTFGCFNNMAKYSRVALDAWAEILHRVPRSRLLLKFHSLDSQGARSWLRAAFQQRGVAPDRILIEGGSTHYELLARYRSVDIGLDTQPYSGGLTTCEALWMGVPVVTFPGQTFAGRHAVSHLTNAGYPQFVAPKLSDYVDLAVHWATHLSDLAAMRSQMRQQVASSPLCDAPRFAGDFLTLIYSAWGKQDPFRWPRPS